MNNISWVTVWGFGADIKTTRDSLLVSRKGKTERYSLDEIKHVIICGNHNFQTSAVETFAEKGIGVSFFDVHGNPTGLLYNGGVPALSQQQKNLPVHKFALTSIKSSIEARMRLLHELSEKIEGGIYYKGEFEIVSGARAELDYLITLAELGRVFTLTKNMYYEIFSRAVPSDLGYRRRMKPPYSDPLNVLLSHGYAVLYANISTACIGAGLDLTKGALYGEIEPAGNGKMPCVLDILEPASVYMVDKIVIDLAREGKISGEYEVGQRCILSDKLLAEFNKRLMSSINREIISANVKHYADAVEGLCEPDFHF
ncbi:MAG: CRISPR-associated endonuclease Cas1 [Methanocorpusculum sp.]|nr:CRISPR-associated endonuclease Cas1 [Methanocorpusculum sp.]